jgi:hypothetical protein
MPDTFCAAMYLAPSLPVIVLPQHLFAGYGGLGRDRYFLVVSMTHLVPLLRRCTLFQYFRSLAYDFFSVVALRRFRVAMFLRYTYNAHGLFFFCIGNFHFIHIFTHFERGVWTRTQQCTHQARGSQCTAGCAWSMRMMRPNVRPACGRL